ncbi:MAG: GNAT family N-acetyltransferase [Massilia sp.]
MNDPAIRCYLHEVPDFVEGELAATYETLQSSLPFLRIWRTLGGASCYVARHAGGPPDILLFRCEGRRLVVLNEMIDIAPAGLASFARYAFAQFPAIHVIRFQAVRTAAAPIGFPVQRYNAKDTFVIALPATPDEYLAALGKSTRANLRSRLNRIAKDFPSFTTRVLNGADIDADVVRQIVQLSEHRIRTRGAALTHDADRMLALARACGFVTVLLIDGRICAGSLNYRVGASVFGEITGHDAAYDRHGVGALCMYHTICESIRSGVRRFYLGGGLFGYKERMLGHRLDMDQVHVYRSYGHVLARADVAAAAFAQGQVRRLKRRLHERKGTWLADLAFRLFHAWKNKSGPAP